MDLCGHFEYNGVSSREYGLVIANAETERARVLSGTINSKTVFNKLDKKKHIVGSDYSESPVSFDIDIITEDERPLESTEKRSIEKWLFYAARYQKLYIDLADDYFGESYDFIDGVQKRYYLNCRFVSPERLEYNGGVIGYKVTVECDSGFWSQEPVVKQFTVNNATGSSRKFIELEVDTDIKDYVYPKVTIQMGTSGGNITIINNTDDASRITKFVGLSKSISLIMKGETNYVSGQNYEKFYYQNFIRLVDGKNTITLEGNITSIEFEFQNKRFL